MRRTRSCVCILACHTSLAHRRRVRCCARLVRGAYRHACRRCVVLAGFTAAAEELGYEARIINVETDANLAVSAISDAIAAGAKGIGLTAPDQSMGPAAAAAAAEAGVYLIATDDPLDDAEGNPVPFAGFDAKGGSV